jgi:hypothetical protein
MRHFIEVGVNSDFVLYSLFQTLLQSVLSLDDSIHIMMMFLLEGQKLVFRIIYALLKLNHEFFLTIKSKKDLIKNLRQNNQ